MVEIGLNGHGETFWDAFTQMPNHSVPLQLHRVRRVGFIRLAACEAEKVREWCEAMPGWDESPLLFLEV